MGPAQITSRLTQKSPWGGGGQMCDRPTNQGQMKLLLSSSWWLFSYRQKSCQSKVTICILDISCELLRGICLCLFLYITDSKLQYFFTLWERAPPSYNSTLHSTTSDKISFTMLWCKSHPFCMCVVMLKARSLHCNVTTIKFYRCLWTSHHISLAFHWF